MSKLHVLVTHTHSILDSTHFTQGCILSHVEAVCEKHLSLKVNLRIKASNPLTQQCETWGWVGPSLEDASPASALQFHASALFYPVNYRTLEIRNH